MPIATLVQKTEKFDLKSCQGGFVIVRRMSYGEKLQRSEMSGQLRILSAKSNKDAVGEMNMLQKSVMIWEFTNLIVEHNLEHQEHNWSSACYNGTCTCPIRPLNFKNPADVELLEGRVGEEIQTCMDKLNNFEEEEETKNSSSGSEPASS